MAGVKVVIADSVVDALMSDWDSGIGRVVAESVAEVAAVARSLAPVSERGSKHAAPGYLKSRVNAAYNHGPDGRIIGRVGIPLSSGSRYPLPFVSNPNFKTRNANQVDGRVRHYGYRPAANQFLLTALVSVMGPATSLGGPTGSLLNG